MELIINGNLTISQMASLKKMIAGDLLTDQDEEFLLWLLSIDNSMICRYWAFCLLRATIKQLRPGTLLCLQKFEKKQENKKIVRYSGSVIERLRMERAAAQEALH